MKNLFIYTGIALVVLVNSIKKPFDIKKEIGFYQDSKKEMIVSKDIKTVLSEDYSSNSEKFSSSKGAAVLKSKTLLLRYFPKTTVKKTIAEDEPIEVVSTTKMNKTADELIAQDNLITENNISNETQALDFDVINGNEVVEAANISKIEKTVDQLFAMDNAITEKNISNETQSLDFEIINKIAKPRN